MGISLIMLCDTKSEVDTMPLNSSTDLDQSCLFVIFGGTGDLTHRKLLPALYKLLKHKLLPDNFAVVSVGRRIKTDD